MTSTSSRAAIISAANDAYRRRLSVLDVFANGRSGGRTVLTSGIAALSADQQLAILRAVARFDCFTRDNDPYGEHDFALVVVDGVRVFFKFDYYESDALEFGADDPQLSCYRLLTIMLAEEY
jgi:Protein of unknown function (DUF3768)